PMTRTHGAHGMRTMNRHTPMMTMKSAPYERGIVSRSTIHAQDVDGVHCHADGHDDVHHC
ncbi:MAG: hypothetical protein ACKOYI_12130, partial [Actinomycetota bacterium]